MAKHILEFHEACSDYTETESSCLQLMDDILNDVEKNIKDYRQWMYERALSKGLCTSCFGRLRLVHVGDETVEYWGTPTNKPIYKNVCVECGEEY